MFIETFFWAGVVAHAFYPSTQEAEAGGFLSLRPAWSTKWVPRQPGLYRETLSSKTKKKKKKKKKRKRKKESKQASIFLVLWHEVVDNWSGQRLWYLFHLSTHHGWFCSSIKDIIADGSPFKMLPFIDDSSRGSLFH